MITVCLVSIGTVYGRKDAKFNVQWDSECFGLVLTGTVLANRT